MGAPHAFAVFSIQDFKGKISPMKINFPANVDIGVLRTNFIPAPEHAANAMKTLKPGDGSLHEALAIYLGKLSGADIRSLSFDLSAIPEHLLMHFERV